MRRIVFGACVLGCIVAVIAWLRLRTDADPRLPDPNGYDLLVEAGREVVDVPNRITDATADELNSFVTANAEVSRKIRQALECDSRVPHTQTSGQSLMLEHINCVRNSARLCYAEIQLAQLQGRWPDAAKQSLELAVLSRKMSRGGLAVDLLAGVAYERLAWTEIQEIAASLTADEKRDFLDRYSETNFERESIEDLMQRERKWSRANNGWLATLMNLRSLGKFRGDMTLRIAEVDASHAAAIQAVKSN